MKKEIKSGDVVLSIAGRDKGKVFLVVEVKDGYAYLIDGKTKKVFRPKKKSPVHIEVINTMALGDMSDEIKNGKPVGAKRIRSALAKQKNIGG